MTEAPRCTSTTRMIADAHTSAADGHVEWAPAKSLWIGGMLAAALLLGPIFVTPGAVALFLVTTVITLCAGHSIGMHRLLVHRSFSAKPWVEYVLVYLGTLVGMAGPIGMVRLMTCAIGRSGSPPATISTPIDFRSCVTRCCRCTPDSY